MAGEFDPSRRRLIVSGLRLGTLTVLPTLGAVILEACDRANTMNVVQEAKFQELGLRGNLQIVDLRTIPEYDNAENGFIVHQKVIQTPEPFSRTEIVDMLTFGWRTNAETPQVESSDIRLDKVRWETLIGENSSPFVTFDLFYDSFNLDTGDPSRLLERHLRSATFHFSPEDLRSFRGDQILLPS